MQSPSRPTSLWPRSGSLTGGGGGTAIRAGEVPKAALRARGLLPDDEEEPSSAERIGANAE